MDFKDLDLSDALLANSSVKWGMGGGAATSIIGGLSSNDVLVIIGVITTLLGFCVNLFYQHKRELRAKEHHALQKKLLEMQIEHEKETSN
jgi:hypothetical protein